MRKCSTESFTARHRCKRCETTDIHEKNTSLFEEVARNMVCLFNLPVELSVNLHRPITGQNERPESRPRHVIGSKDFFNVSVEN